MAQEAIVDKLIVDLEASTRSATTDLNSVLESLSRLETAVGKLAAASEARRKAAAAQEAASNSAEAQAKREARAYLSATQAMARMESVAKRLQSTMLGAQKNGMLDTSWYNSLMAQYGKIQEILNTAAGDPKALASMFNGDMTQVSQTIADANVALNEYANHAETAKLGTMGLAEASKAEAKAATQAEAANKAGATAIKQLGNAAKESTGKTNGFFSSIVRIAKYRLIRSALRMITQGFKEGLDKMYEFSAKTGGEFSQNMDRLASSVDYLTSSLGTLLAPIIDLLTPALEFLIDLVAEAAQAVGWLFAQISGSDWSPAVKQQKKYKDALDDTAGAAKEAVRQLMGFDELNVITSPKDRGSGNNDEISSPFGNVGGGKKLTVLPLIEKLVQGKTNVGKDDDEKNDKDKGEESKKPSGGMRLKEWLGLLAGEKEGSKATATQTAFEPAFAGSSAMQAALMAGVRPRTYSGSGRNFEPAPVFKPNKLKGQEIVPIYNDMGMEVGYAYATSGKNVAVQELETGLAVAGALPFLAGLTTAPGFSFGGAFAPNIAFGEWSGLTAYGDELTDTDKKAKKVQGDVAKIGTTNVSPKNLLSFSNGAVAYTGKEADETGLKVAGIGKKQIVDTNMRNAQGAVAEIGTAADNAGVKVAGIGNVTISTGNIEEFKKSLSFGDSAGDVAKSLGLDKLNPIKEAFGSLATDTKTWFEYLDKIKRLGSLNISESVAKGAGLMQTNTLKVGFFAEGGFPEQGSLALIGENVGETEIIGNVNGRTGVVGGAEITGIADAVDTASARERELLAEQNTLLRGILEKTGKIRLAPNAAAGRWVAQANRAYARVTGV